MVVWRRLVSPEVFQKKSSTNTKPQESLRRICAPIGRPVLLNNLFHNSSWIIWPLLQLVLRQCNPLIPIHIDLFRPSAYRSPAGNRFPHNQINSKACPLPSSEWHALFYESNLRCDLESNSTNGCKNGLSPFAKSSDLVVMTRSWAESWNYRIPLRFLPT